MLRDRSDAGRLLAARLNLLADERPAVLGLPRGGAPVAFEVGSALRAPLDVIVVRKLGVPYQPELAMGAIGENGARVIDDEVIRMTGVSSEVGQAHRDFTQTTDDEVERPLSRAATFSGPAVASAPGADRDVLVAAEGVSLAASLVVPHDATGVVIFAHGSGSSRHSPRNRYVASVLNDRGIATLLIDLLTVDEERDRRLVFDIELLARRLAAATAWVREDESMQNLKVCYFGASTGAGAALAAAGEPGADIAAIVSRGGRPDLAGPKLSQVTAPTLLIVGGADHQVLELNRLAQSRMRCPTRLEIVPGATHLFEEPGALSKVAELAGGWFSLHLPGAGALGVVAGG